MSNTRFKSDEACVIKQLQQSTDPGRWILNVPGNGIEPSYMEDIHIRAQRWGGNLMTNSVDLESNLRGITTVLHKGLSDNDDYKIRTNVSHKVYYPSSNDLYTDQMRQVQPVWEMRNVEINNWLEPLRTVEKSQMIPLQEYQMDTRNLERDNYNKSSNSATYE